MKSFKKLILFLFLGAPVGATITSFLAPPLVEAMHAPVGERSALCNCHDLAGNIMSTFWTVQLIGTGVGALIGAVIWFALLRLGRLHKKAKPAAKEETVSSEDPA